MTFVEYLDHGDQAATDQLKWHHANNPKLTQAQIDAFKAGFGQAWLKALADIRLHGMPRER